MPTKLAPGAPELVDHLFRHEAGRMVARLTRLLGPRQLDLAEEAVQDAICTALETWKFYGPPENPGAWLMRAAQNRAIDLVRRNQRLRGVKAKIAVDPDFIAAMNPGAGDESAESGLHDDRLALMLSCCHPKLPVPAQLALILKALCGFGTNEIAAAFFVNAPAIEKRVTRAKNFLKQSKSLFDLDDAAQVRGRLGSVHQAIYLMFSEGYHSVRADAPTRRDLCLEAIRLALLLDADQATQTPETDALLALMYFDLARLSARVDDEGVYLPLAQQDRSLWDQRLIALGLRYLEASARGTHFSRFHIEAGIASKHCLAARFEDTDWPGILELYDRLAESEPSPIIALNRAIIWGQVRGAEAGLAALAALGAEETLRDYPFLHAALGEFHHRKGDLEDAAASFEKALNVARSPAEKHFFERKIMALTGKQTALISP